MGIRIRWFAAGLAAALGQAGARDAVGQTLVGRAILPSDTFAPGPVSGRFITPANGVNPPFASQPVQGFSALIADPSRTGGFLAMPDNGYGAKANSADFLLRVYSVTPDFKTAQGGTGTVAVNGYFTLSDPSHLAGFPIVADKAFYPNGAGNIPVDPTITAGRLLTGSDFDLESMRIARDGSFYFGEEFGPFLLHTDAKGHLLEAPISPPGVKSPDNPFLGSDTPNAQRSGGFEGMALSPDGKTLTAILKKPFTSQPGQLNIYQYDLTTHSFTTSDPNVGAFKYHLDPLGSSVTDLTAVNDHEFLAIERDNVEGASAKFKEVFLVDTSKTDANGFVQKTPLVDLLHIADPNNLSGTGTGQFSFPYITPESVLILDAHTIALVNDNNYPFSNSSAVPGIPGPPDANDFILIHLDQALAVPEPSSLILLGLGAGALGLYIRRRASRRAARPGPCIAACQSSREWAGR